MEDPFTVHGQLDEDYPAELMKGHDYRFQEEEVEIVRSRNDGR